MTNKIDEKTWDKLAKGDVNNFYYLLFSLLSSSLCQIPRWGSPVDDRPSPY